MTRSGSRSLGLGAAFVLLFLAVACGSTEVASPRLAEAPTVTSNTPVLGATSVALDVSLSATFSEAMDPVTITPSTFTLTHGPGAVPVEGTVTYADSKAVFVPAGQLDRDDTYFATITTGARNAAGDPLPASRSWRFSTVKPTVVCMTFPR